MKLNLFLATSVDGNITFGREDIEDFDLLCPLLNVTLLGWKQYYEEESNTDIWSINSATVMNKVWNTVRNKVIPKNHSTSCNMVVIDRGSLAVETIEYLSKAINPLYKLIIYTSNSQLKQSDYPDCLSRCDIRIHPYVGLVEMLQHLEQTYDVEEATLQTGGTLNAQFFKLKLISTVNMVIPPVITGNSAVPMIKELDCPVGLELVECNQLQYNYVQLKYDVIYMDEHYSDMKELVRGVRSALMEDTKLFN